MNKIELLFAHIRHGLQSNIPLCCIAWYVSTNMQFRNKFDKWGDSKYREIFASDISRQVMDGVKEKDWDLSLGSYCVCPICQMRGNYRRIKYGEYEPFFKDKTK